ncbi:MAG: DNA alkylation repair protein [Candidatus Njordarchaeota archaeon]
MKAFEIVELLTSLKNEKNIEGMKKYGITSRATILGIPKPELRKIAKKIGVNHKLALELWDTNIHEARIIATLIADPEKIDEQTLDTWVRDIDNWDLCDQCILNLF